MIHPTVYNTSQILRQHGIQDVVLSPGSRNAPLIVSFARNTAIKKWIVPDERSAAFIALGIAQVTQKPVALCCTSGSAVLNYSPAIAEAYYREIPLLVLSADRPPELIDQRDGQTIRQFKALDNHVKKSWNLPVVHSEEDATAYEKALYDALKAAVGLPKGPVHLNIPFREPFYPTPDQQLDFSASRNEASSQEPGKRPESISVSGKILILVGQMHPDPGLQIVLEQLATQVPVLAAPLSNVKTGIENYDSFLLDQEQLAPDVLITFGLSVLSKKTKQWIRKFKPGKHFHIDPAGVPVDTFASNPELLQTPIANQLADIAMSGIDASYLQDFETLSEVSHKAVSDFFLSSTAFSESHAVYHLFKNLPENSRLHLGNSMPVRYAELFKIPKTTTVYSNRGTSGIDGSTSTMIGSSLADPEHLHILLTGDVAFLYDRNAFFHNHLPSNIRIVVLNNQGGGIFRLIDGPRNLPELETYFETRHNRTAEHICAENKLGYKQIHQLEDLKRELECFFNSKSNTQVLEIFTDPENNQKQFKNLKTSINERIID